MFLIVYLLENVSSAAAVVPSLGSFYPILSICFGLYRRCVTSCFFFSFIRKEKKKKQKMTKIKIIFVESTFESIEIGEFVI